MAPTLLVNIPTFDVDRARRFFTAIGFRVDDLVGDDGTAVVEVGRSRVMLHRCDRFAGYAKLSAASPPRVAAVLSVAVDGRDDVDTIVTQAIRLGAQPLRTVEDPGFMYSRSFRDLDGNGWDVVWMDPGGLSPN